MAQPMYENICCNAEIVVFILTAYMCMGVCVGVCARVCVCASVRACVGACVSLSALILWDPMHAFPKPYSRLYT